MPDIFLNATGGSDANSGATWALSKASLGTGVAAIDAAGDRVLIDAGHAETLASGLGYTTPGTAAAPVQLLSVTQSGASGIGALTPGALFNATGSTILLDGHLYAYGITFRVSNNGSINFTFGGSTSNVQQIYDNCNIESTGAGGTTTIVLGDTPTGGGSKRLFRNCNWKFGAAGQIVTYQGEVIIQGGAIAAGGTSPTAVFKPGSGGRGGNLLVSGFDFSNCSSGVNLHGVTQCGDRAVFRDCKVPASWTGRPVTAANANAGGRVEGYNLHNATTRWRVWVVDYAYEVTDDTTVTMTGGYADGATAYSLKIATTANLGLASPARTPDQLIGITSTGSAVTLTAEIVHDTNVAVGQGAGTSFAFRDDEVWIEAEVFDTSGSYLTTVKSDAVSSVIATPADQTSSSATWTTTGLTTPVKQALAVTFTPQQIGYAICRVVVGKASKTLWVGGIVKS